MAQARRTKKKAKKPSARENVRKRKISPPKARAKPKKPTFQKAKGKKTAKRVVKKAPKRTAKKTPKPSTKKTAVPKRRGYGIAGGKQTGKRKLPPGFLPVGSGGAPEAPKGKKKGGKKGGKSKKTVARRWTEKLADRTAAYLKVRIEEIRDGLLRDDWSPTYRVHRYADGTIDGELIVPIFPERSGSDVITAMVLTVVRLARPLETFPAQYVSHGILLGPRSQARRRDAANPYKRFRGNFRLNVHWQNILDSEVNAKTMLEVMRNARKLHRAPPIGVLVRWAWSVDGLLHRGR